MGVRLRGPAVDLAGEHTPQRCPPRCEPTSAWRVTRKLAWAALLLVPGCFGLSEEDEALLSIYKDNTETYFRQGEYVQAMANANRAIELDDELPELRVIRAYCLLRLGEASNNVSYVDQSVEQFDSIVDDYDADEQFRGYLGAGSAHLSRALAAEREGDAIASRLDRGFLDAAEASVDQAKLTRARELQLDHLDAAEESIRAVLELDVHRDNSYALQHLVMVLNRQGRDAETVAAGERALALLEENSRVVESLLERNAKLTPARQLELQKQVEMNEKRERLLRDLISTVHANNGDAVAALGQLSVLEDRGLMSEAQYYNRAALYESLGQNRAAVADLEAFLRIRAQYMSFEEDEMASPTFARIERLSARAR